jgi:hypothetical protein
MRSLNYYGFNRITGQTDTCEYVLESGFFRMGRRDLLAQIQRKPTRISSGSKAKAVKGGIGSGGGRHSASYDDSAELELMGNDLYPIRSDLSSVVSGGHNGSAAAGFKRKAPEEFGRGAGSGSKEGAGAPPALRHSGGRGDGSPLSALSFGAHAYKQQRTSTGAGAGARAGAAAGSAAALAPYMGAPYILAPLPDLRAWPLIDALSAVEGGSSGIVGVGAGAHIPPPPLSFASRAGVALKQYSEALPSLPGTTRPFIGIGGGSSPVPQRRDSAGGSAERPSSSGAGPGHTGDGGTGMPSLYDAALQSSPEAVGSAWVGGGTSPFGGARATRSNERTGSAGRPDGSPPHSASGRVVGGPYGSVVTFAPPARAPSLSSSSIGLGGGFAGDGSTPLVTPAVLRPDHFRGGSNAPAGLRPPPEPTGAAWGAPPVPTGSPRVAADSDEVLPGSPFVCGL